MGRWGRGWHFPDPKSAPRSLVHIVGCSSRGRGNCGKLRAVIEPCQQPRDTEFSKRCANGGKTTASTCQFSSRTTCFSTVCIVRQFPWPAFDWRHLPIYRMNQRLHIPSSHHLRPLLSREILNVGPVYACGFAQSFAAESGANLSANSTKLFQHRPLALVFPCGSGNVSVQQDQCDQIGKRHGCVADVSQVRDDWGVATREQSAQE